MISRLFIAMSIVLILAGGAFADHPSESVPKVLILQSYHPGFVWSDEVNRGIFDQFKESHQHARFDVQYLDAKHTLGTQVWSHIYEILQTKYANRSPDLIFAIDDAAVQFLMHYSSSLFPETPVVFAGVTHFDSSWSQKRPQLTGVLEKEHLLETIEVARTLDPHIQHIVVINDGTMNGIYRHIMAILTLEEASPRLTGEHWIDLSHKELVRRLGNLGEGSMVVFGSIYRDIDGELFTGEDLADLVKSAAPVPMYVMNSALMGQGFVGGVLNRGESHARTAARQALRVLQGEEARNIPMVEGAAEAEFDYHDLVRFGYDVARLPAGSEVIHRPLSFVARHPQLVELIIFAALLLLVVHMASVVMLRVKNRAAAVQKQNLELLQTILDSIPDPVFYKDAEGRYLGGNQHFFAAIGFSREQVVGKTVYEIAPSDLAQVYHRADLDLIEQGGTQSYETEVRFADGKRHDVLFHKAVFPGVEGQPGGMVGAMVDISERKSIEDAQRESEERFRNLFDTSPDAAILSGDGEGILDVNRSFIEQTGISREQAMGKSSQELNLWKDPADRERLLEALRSKGAVDNLGVTVNTLRGERDGLVSARLVEITGKQHMLFVVRDITELRRTERALEQSEMRLRTVFEASPDAILISRAGGGGIVDVNVGFTRLWGYEREEVLWRSTGDLGLWLDEKRRLEMRRELQENGFVDNFEIPIRCRDGSVRICSASCRLVDIDGHPCTLAVLRDITRFKAAEEALRESEQKFQAVFHQTYQFMAILDAEGRILEVNDTALNLYGLKPSDVEGHYFWESPWWSKGEQREMIRLGVETAAHGNLFQVRTNHLKADGSLVHIDFSLKPVRDAWGEIIYLIPEGRDITGLYVAEQALRQSEKRYRDLSGQFQNALDGVPDVMMLFEPSGKLVWGNQSAAKVFGVGEEDYGVKRCSDLWGEKEQCAACSHATFSQGKSWEELVETPDGLSWGIKTFPILDDQGEVINVLQIATDLTEKMRLRDQASRSAHLAALGEVAAGVAHEINNPAGLLLMDLGLLEDVYRDLVPVIEQYREEHGEFECGGLSVGRVLEQVPPVFEELRDGAARIKRIVEELKEFANPHAEAIRQTVDLNEVVNRALRLTRKSLDLNCKRVEVELDAHLQTFPGNAQRLEQVVINLLLNASQAVAGYGEVIRVKTAMDTRRQVVSVAVIDDGRGIPADKLKMITDPFFTTRREEGGTGLGLSVSSRIIDEHHGVLNFSSQVGQGTTVTIELPLQAPEGEG